jgi:hypothetical protein
LRERRGSKQQEADNQGELQGSDTAMARDHTSPI